MKSNSWMRSIVLALGLATASAAQAQSAVGRTEGVASVSATGAARYVIPLKLPPGTNGLAPSLSVAYDSRGGNGLLGVGFRVSGLSAIQRCARNIAQDGAPGPVALDAADRFCLDGKRLRLASGIYGTAGSQYRTEVDEFSRVTAYGLAGTGPASFVVETRDGLIYEYGATADSRVEAVGSTTARYWALNRLRDRAGNFVDFVYAEDTVNGSLRPLRIDYTGNTATGATPYYSVRFYYEPRPAGDALTGWNAGGRLTEVQRLDRIEVQHVASGTMLRRYDLTYSPTGPSGRSRLASLQECAATECLPATTFGWAPYTSGWSSTETATGIIAANTFSAIPGDLDGDGYEDFIYFDALLGHWYVIRGGVAGYSGSRIDVGLGSATNAGESVSIDVDGDGKRDVLMLGYTKTTLQSWFWLRHSSGTAFSLTAVGLNNVAAPGSNIALDVDGDGLEDLVYAKPGSPSIFWRRNLTSAGMAQFDVEYPLWTSPYGAVVPSNPFSALAQRLRSMVRRGDFNDDGRPDLLIKQQYDCRIIPGCSGMRTEWQALVSRGTSFETRAVFATSSSPLMGDFNGDGLTDVTYPVVLTDGSTSWRLRFATGAGLPGSQAFTAEIATSVGTTAANAMIVDWDGDGRADLVYPAGSSGWQYCRSNGTTLAACTLVGSALPTISGAPMVTDPNGDGLADVLYAATNWRFRLHEAGQPEMLETAVDGLGNSAAFRYATLLDPTVHTPTSGAVFPVREYMAPLQVVSRLTQSDGAGGTYAISTSYVGARMHANGRGFLGFARRTSVDSRSGLNLVEETYQDPLNWDLLGRPYAVTLKQTNGNPVSRQAFTWQRAWSGNVGDQRSAIWLGKLVTDRHELDGARVTSSATINTVDAFGTLTDSTTTVTEVARGLNTGAQHVSRVTLLGVVNDTANWCLGRPSSTQLRRSHTLAGGAEIVRTTEQTWDYARCRMLRSVTEPASATLRVASDLGYDSYGNLASTTVTPSGLPARRTSYAWSDYGRFPSSTTFPEGLVTSSTWDATMARRVQERDAQGRQTSWRYDGFNHVALQTEPDGTSTAYARYTCGAAGCASSLARFTVVGTRRDTGGVALATEERGFDPQERAVYVKRELPRGGYSLSLRRLDARGMVAQLSVPSPCCGTPTRWVSYSYDVLGRLLSVSRPLSEVDGTVVNSRRQYDGLGFTDIDELGHASVRRTDSLGNVLQVIDPAGADTDYVYDAFDNLLKVRDYAGNETNLAYDAHGRRTSAVDPDAGRATYTYNALGQLQSQTNARGQVTSYAYDLLGRAISRTEPEGVTTWTWGSSAAAMNVGELASVTGPGFQETYAYDALGRRSSVVRTVSGSTLVTGISYDAATGQLDTLTYPALAGTAPLRVKHVFDRGRLVKLGDADNAAVTFWQADGVDVSGRVIAATLGNGVKVASAWDAVNGRLVSRGAGPGGGATYQNLRYAWDAAGNLAQRTDLNRNSAEQFYYDSRNRLDYVNRSGVTTLDLAYDDIGNTVSKSDVGAYRYDASHKHAAVAAGTNAYTYDANGDVVTASGASLAWTSYDLPSQITHPNGNYASFYYGPDRARFRQVARAATHLTDTVYGPDGLYERYTRDGVTGERQYVVAGGEIVAVRNRTGTAAATTTYLLQDHLGSVDAYLSSSGALLAKASYQPMGARRSGDGIGTAPTAAEWQVIQDTTSRGFTGHEHLDNLGVIHMNGRVFDPILGRFLSPDPYVQSPYDAQSLNRYSYVLGNPLRYTDPSGFCSLDREPTQAGTVQCTDGTPGIVVSVPRNPVFDPDSIFSAAYNQLLSSQLQQNLLFDALRFASSDAGLEASLAGGVPQPAMENIVVTARRINDDLANVVAIPVWPSWLSELKNVVKVRPVALGGLGFGIALGLLSPSELAQDDDLLDEEGELKYVYHFTNDIGQKGIVAQSALLPGMSGFVYVSPVPYPNATAAQSALSLPRTPTGYFQIPRRNIASPLVWTPVTPNFGQTGGGFEAAVPGPVPITGAMWVPLGP